MPLDPLRFNIPLSRLIFSFPLNVCVCVCLCRFSVLLACRSPLSVHLHLYCLIVISVFLFAGSPPTVHLDRVSVTLTYVTSSPAVCPLHVLCTTASINDKSVVGWLALMPPFSLRRSFCYCHVGPFPFIKHVRNGWFYWLPRFLRFKSVSMFALDLCLPF